MPYTFSEKKKIKEPKDPVISRKTAQAIFADNSIQTLKQKLVLENSRLPLWAQHRTNTDFSGETDGVNKDCDFSDNV